MTMLAEIAQDKIEYEPTVQDKIQRVLSRLENGEELTKYSLRNGDNFCIMGMFADESGIGHWVNETYVVHGGVSVAGYFNIKTGSGNFEIDELPEGLAFCVRSLLNDSMYSYILFSSRQGSSLTMINDLDGVPPMTKNRLLAEIIKSGVIFDDR